MYFFRQNENNSYYIDCLYILYILYIYIWFFWQVRLGSRLHALWNRSAGDCLLDSVLQVGTMRLKNRDSSR